MYSMFSEYQGYCYYRGVAGNAANRTEQGVPAFAERQYKSVSQRENMDDTETIRD